MRRAHPPPRASLRRAPRTGIRMTLRKFKALTLPLCAACLVLAGWMVYHSLSGAPLAGCGTGSGCDSVTGSRWAWIFGGVPVGLPAAAVYALLGICILFFGGESSEDHSLDRFLWPLMSFLGGCIIGAAIWFCYLQAFVLHAFCLYCTLLHVLGCILAALVLFGPAGRRYLWFAAGLAAAAVFAVIQSNTLPDSVYDAGEAEAALPTFAEEEIPVLGDGEETLTLLFDFQCTHCRRLHTQLPEFLSLAGGQYRLFLCPVPLSSACNPYIPTSGIDRFAGSCPLTRLALAVWYARPDAYVPFWDWLLGDGDPRALVTPAEAEQRVRALLGDAFDAALADPRIDTYLRKAEELFGRTSAGQGAVPRLIRGQHWLVPETDNPDALLALVREQL